MENFLFLFKTQLQCYLLCKVFPDNPQPFLLHHFHYLCSYRAVISINSTFIELKIVLNARNTEIISIIPTLKIMKNRGKEHFNYI